MNKKLLVPLLGALILGSSTLALADRGSSPIPQASDFRQMHDNGRHGDRGWRNDDGPRHRYDHGPRYRHERWSPPHGHHHWHPAPRWGHYDRPHYYGHQHGHGRDGVSIIFRGHIN